MRARGGPGGARAAAGGAAATNRAPHGARGPVNPQAPGGRGPGPSAELLARAAEVRAARPSGGLAAAEEVRARARARERELVSSLTPTPPCRPSVRPSRVLSVRSIVPGPSCGPHHAAHGRAPPRATSFLARGARTSAAE